LPCHAAARRQTLRFLILGAALFLWPLRLFASPPRHVAYTVAIADIPTQQFHVTVKAEGVDDPTVSFAIPAWSPGWYVLTNAYKNISHVSATDAGGKPLAVATVDKLTWRVTTNGAQTITLSYDLKAKDQDPEAVGIGTGTDKDYGFFAPYLDAANGFVPGPASLMYVVDATSAPCSVTYKTPDGWQIASANDPTTDPRTFTAPNYDTLADQPADLGHFVRYDRTIRGVPFSIVLVGADGRSHGRWVDACWRIVEAGLRVFGKAPFPRYIFHFRFPESSPAMEGLEHLNATVISLPASALTGPDLAALSVTAHEFTHAWNVKRIRPEKLGPFDYTREVRVKDLWWLEGVTDYYAPRLVVEAGLAGEDYWRGYISEILTTVQNNPARTRVTLETASLKAWEGRSEGYDGLSYYEKGLFVGLLLDIEMRRRTDNRVGIDDLMDALLKETQTSGKGYPDGEIERLASKLCGADLGPFFDKALRTTEELSYSDILPAAGLRLDQAKVTEPDFGIDFDAVTLAEGGLRLGRLTTEGPAETAGLREGDVIIAVDGTPIGKIAGALLDNRHPGDPVNLSVRRNGEHHRFRLTLGSKEEVVYDLLPIPDPTPQQRALLAHVSGSALGGVEHASTQP